MLIASNRPITVEAAESISDTFTEVIAAPGFDEGAREILLGKTNLRLLELPEGYRRARHEIRQVSGGMLVQIPDTHFAAFGSWTLVAGDDVDDSTRADLEFAWRAVRGVKSNAILLARDEAAIGIGAGQMSRVDSVFLAVHKARQQGHEPAGSVLASDAFFPFADGVEHAVGAGVTAIIQPGGSVRDAEVVEAADKQGVAMIMTGKRQFRH